MIGGKHKQTLSSVSFFSFQDIITGLTGIMMLVILLLALGIARSKLEPTVHPTATTGGAAERPSAEAATQQLLQLRNEFRTRMRQKSVPEHSAPDTSERNVERQIQQRFESEQLRQQKKNQELARQLQAQTAKIAQLSLEQAQWQNSPLLSVREAQLEQLETQLQQAEQEVQRSRHPVRLPAEHDNRKILVADLRRNGIDLFLPGAPQAQVLRDDAATMQGILEQFQNILAQTVAQNPDWECIFLVRQESAEYFSLLRQQLHERFPKLLIGSELLLEEEFFQPEAASGEKPR